MDQYDAKNLIAELKGIRSAIESVARQAKQLFGAMNNINVQFPSEKQGGIKSEEEEKSAMGLGPRTTNPIDGETVAKTSRVVKSAGYPEEFEAFWKAYPPRGKPAVRNGKQLAYKAWKKVPSEFKKSLDRIAEEQVKRSMLGRDPQFYPMASTWLNQCRYLDVAEGPVGEGLSGEDFESEDQQKEAWEGGWGE